MMDIKSWVEIIATGTMPIAIIGVIVNRIKGDRGLGVRAIQFLGLCLFAPLILILALEQVLEKSAIGALVGALLGYLFANIGEFDKKRGQKESDD